MPRAGRRRQGGARSGRRGTSLRTGEVAGRRGAERRKSRRRGKERTVFFIMDGIAGNFDKNEEATAGESSLPPAVKIELGKS